eukprot:762134-Hanusia_phi.AAC.2
MFNSVQKKYPATKLQRPLHRPVLHCPSILGEPHARCRRCVLRALSNTHSAGIISAESHKEINDMAEMGSGDFHLSLGAHSALPTSTPNRRNISDRGLLPCTGISGLAGKIPKKKKSARVASSEVRYSSGQLLPLGVNPPLHSTGRGRCVDVLLFRYVRVHTKRSEFVSEGTTFARLKVELFA